MFKKLEVNWQEKIHVNVNKWFVDLLDKNISVEICKYFIFKFKIYFTN